MRVLMVIFVVMIMAVVMRTLRCVQELAGSVCVDAHDVLQVDFSSDCAVNGCCGIKAFDD